METDPLPHSIFPGLFIQTCPAAATVTAATVFIVILLLLSALISGIERICFAPGMQNRLKPSTGKNKLSASILRDSENPERLAATLMVAGNFLNIAIILFSALVVRLIAGTSKAGIGGYILLSVFIAFILLFFTEVLPYIYTTRYAALIVRIMALPVKIMGTVFKPFRIALFYFSSKAGTQARPHSDNISLNELSQALELTRADENYEDKEILEGIVQFGHKKVAEIMRSKADVIALDLKDPFEKVIRVINESGYSRIPVYSGSFDHIKGILYIKDLLPFINKQESFHWQTIIRPPFYVSEAKKIDDLLEEFQKNKVHMAIVINEKRTSSGIVTLQDVLEEIVGDILDEFDE